MFALYFLAGIACFIALFTLFNRYYIIFLPRKRERLWLVIEGDIPHIEAIMRELYSFLQHKAWFEPVVVDKSSGDCSLILEKFCQSYTLPLGYELPAKFSKQLFINEQSDIKALKKELALLRSELELPDSKKAKGKREGISQEN